MKLAAQLADWLVARGLGVLIPKDQAGEMGRPDPAATDDEVTQADFMLVLGGDGTMLRWSRIAAPKGTPIMGVNFGQYGFITEIHPDEVKPAMERVLAGDYIISERVMLKATVTRDDQPMGTYYALNEAVVGKGPFARLLGLHTYVGGQIHSHLYGGRHHSLHPHGQHRVFPFRRRPGGAPGCIGHDRHPHLSPHAQRTFTRDSR